MRNIPIAMFALLLAAGPAYAQQEPPPAQVVTVPVTQQSVAPTTLIMGVLDFDLTSGISPEVSGRIESQNMTEGALVKKGEVLVRLSTDFMEKRIQSVKLKIDQAQVKIENTRRNLARYEVLYKEKAATEKAYEDLADQLAELDKEKAILQNELAQLRLEQQKSVIAAPFDGIILDRLHTVGEWVSPGNPVCELASTESLVARVPVPEDLVRWVSAGAGVSLKIPALGMDVTGRVAGFVPVADPQSKTFTVKVSVPYFPQAIRNMSVAAYVPAGEKKTLKMFPRDALVRVQGQEMVFTVADGKAQPVPITVSAYQGSMVGVENSHIQEGMPVVVEGNERLRPGQPVTAIPKAGAR
ncbi:MAG: efflux RND transporter periplasmic adaptor subunit [Deltaproteobacteria bacterium]|nr:efflux RND transporter periplasmic adaptor subunit [Deltaproteobacteria bacterium]